MPDRGAGGDYTAIMNAPATKGRLDNSIRLFMAPGITHGRGGEGPNGCQGRPHATALRIPESGALQGSGSVDDAANFTCRLPRAGPWPETLNFEGNYLPGATRPLGRFR